MAKSAKAMSKSEDEEYRGLVDAARTSFYNMQRSWWDFAKALFTIKESEKFKLGGHETFKDFCLAEYPTVDYTVMTKFTRIAEEWGSAIEAKIKDKDWQLPAYESCYKVITMKEVPKEELTKIKKSVLDGKLTYESLKDKLKELIDKTRKKVREEVDVSMDKIESDLTKELETSGELEDGFDEEDFMPTDEFAGEEDEVEDFKDSGDVSINALKSRIKYLNENLPEFSSEIEGMDLTDGLIELAEELDKLQTHIEVILKKVEDKNDD